MQVLIIFIIHKRYIKWFWWSSEQTSYTWTQAALWLQICLELLIFQHFLFFFFQTRNSAWLHHREMKLKVDKCAWMWALIVSETVTAICVCFLHRMTASLMGCELCLSSMPPRLGSTHSPSCTPERRVSASFLYFFNFFFKSDTNVWSNYHLHLNGGVMCQCGLLARDSFWRWEKSVTLKPLASCYFSYARVCWCFINCSARAGDAAGVGHLSHHASGVDNLRGSCLDIRMSLDEEENSK